MGFWGRRQSLFPSTVHVSVSSSSGGPCPAMMQGICGVGKVVGGNGGRVLSKCGMRRVRTAAWVRYHSTVRSLLWVQSSLFCNSTLCCLTQSISTWYTQYLCMSAITLGSLRLMRALSTRWRLAEEGWKMWRLVSLIPGRLKFGEGNAQV